MKQSKWFIGALVVALLLTGCASLGVSVPDTTSTQVPVECRDAMVYKVPNFMPGGPVAIRVAAATAFTIAEAAGHPEVRGLFAAAAPLAFRAIMQGNLSSGLTTLTTSVGGGKWLVYTQPFLVLLSSLEQPNLKMNECDKNVLGSLIKNIGLDAGAKLSDF